MHADVCKYREQQVKGHKASMLGMFKDYLNIGLGDRGKGAQNSHTAGEGALHPHP